MTASEDRARQTHHEHHGTLQKQLHLRSLVLFGLAYMTPIIVLGIFGVIAELSDGGSAGSYLLATVAMLFTALSYGLMAKHFPVAGSAYTYVRKALDSRLGFVVGWAILLDYLFLPLVIWLIGGSYLQGQFPNVPFFVWIVAYIVLTSALNVIGLKVADRTNFVLMTVQLLDPGAVRDPVDHTPGQRFAVAGVHHTVHRRWRVLGAGGRCRGRGVLVPRIRRHQHADRGDVRRRAQCAARDRGGRVDRRRDLHRGDLLRDIGVARRNLRQRGLAGRPISQKPSAAACSARCS